MQKYAFFPDKKMTKKLYQSNFGNTREFLYPNLFQNYSGNHEIFTTFFEHSRGIYFRSFSVVIYLIQLYFVFAADYWLLYTGMAIPVKNINIQQIVSILAL